MLRKPYQDLSLEQKIGVKQLFLFILNQIDGQENFRLVETDRDFGIRQSISAPPSLERINQLKDILAAMTYHIEFDTLLTPIPALFLGHLQPKSVQVSYYRIINFKALFLDHLEKLYHPKIPKPNNISPEQWYALSDLIKKYWYEFSEELQSHTFACLKESLNVKYISSITANTTCNDCQELQAPKIPVLLPNFELKSVDSNKIYDLMEVLLEIEKRVSDHTLQAHTPVKYLNVSLENIVPAPESLLMHVDRFPVRNTL